jgi:hypothetical protein
MHNWRLLLNYLIITWHPISLSIDIDNLCDPQIKKEKRKNVPGVIIKKKQ